MVIRFCAGLSFLLSCVGFFLSFFLSCKVSLFCNSFSLSFFLSCQVSSPSFFLSFVPYSLFFPLPVFRARISLLLSCRNFSLFFVSGFFLFPSSLSPFLFLSFFRARLSRFFLAFFRGRGSHRARTEASHAPRPAAVCTKPVVV